jgi:hypothetical protein
MKTLISILFIISLSVSISYGQSMLIFQPSEGLNDGTDTGTEDAGKDAWVNRYTPNENYGAYEYSFSSPRSNCNTSDYKSYFQFDVSTLPDVVDSVFFGITHIEHTSYCYSNCDADFYFYLVTSPWDEMGLIQSNLPSEQSEPFFGPLNITFPNDFQNQEYDITTAYNYWKTEGNENHGFVTYSPTVGCNNAAVQIMNYSSDDSIPERRPYLKIYYHTSTSVNTLSATKEIKAYPNPFNDFLKVDKDAFESVALKDILGRNLNLVYDNSLGGFNTSTLKPGMYVITLSDDRGQSTLKVIKE